MAYLFYNILLTVFLLLAVPYSFFRPSFRRNLAQRLGFFPGFNHANPLWVHVASVGEVFCAIPLIKKIKKEFPHDRIMMTTMTLTGNEAAKKSLPEVDRVLFLPADHPLILHRMLKRVQPRLLLIAETELWPNLLRASGKKGIPVILFNGRISKKSFPRYRLLKFFFRRCLKNISLFLMQTDEDRNRIIQVGAPSERVKVVGNLKFDQTSPLFTQETKSELAKSLTLQGKETILIAGSTHSGEEEMLTDLFNELREIDPHLVLFLAPRHLERIEEVEKMLKKKSLPWVRRTSLSADQNRFLQEGKAPPQVILLDTMGELMALYSLGTLIFIGGSLVPVGGHNPLEPLFFKKCVLFGPHMFNFLEISLRLSEARGAIQVRGKEDLASHLKRLLSDQREREETGERGYQFLQKHRGATERMIEEIRPFLT